MTHSPRSNHKAAFCKVDMVRVIFFINASGQKLLKLSSFLHCLFFTSFLPFKERVPGLHVGPREAAVGQISDDTGQFRDLGKREEKSKSQPTPSDCQKGFTLNAGTLAAKPVFNSDWKLVPTGCFLSFPLQPPYLTTLTSLPDPGSCSPSSPERLPSPTKPRSPTQPFLIVPSLVSHAVTSWVSNLTLRTGATQGPLREPGEAGTLGAPAQGLACASATSTHRPPRSSRSQP